MRWDDSDIFTSSISTRDEEVAPGKGGPLVCCRREEEEEEEEEEGLEELN